MTTTLRLTIASCQDLTEQGRRDDAALIERLARHNITATPVPWTDTAHPWTDPVLIRTTWDYMNNLPAFLDWLDRTAARTAVLNPPSLVRPNTDKTYLKRLAPHTVPTIWLGPAPNAAAISHALDDAQSRGWHHLAVKPTVDAGAKGLLIAPADERDRITHHIHAITHNPSTERGAIIQPLLETLPTRGEPSVVLIEGEPTHAVRKTPAPGDYRCQGEFGGTYTLEQPSPQALELVSRASALWASEPQPPLYARVDTVELPPPLRTNPSAAREGAIIEVELIEPELFFTMATSAADRLAEALRRRLEAHANL